MRDLQSAAGPARDGDGLVDRFEEPVVLVPHVGVVGKADGGQRTADGNEFVEGRECTRRVLEPARRADGALGERLFDECEHPCQFRGSRGAIGVAHDDPADRPEADQRGDVRAGLDGGDRVEERSHAATVAARRARGAVGADDDGRDALPDDRLHQRVVEERAVGVGVHVDESGGDDVTAAVDLGRAAIGEARRDADHAVAGDRDVGVEARSAGTVDDDSASEHEVGVTAAEADERRCAEHHRSGACAGAEEVAAFHPLAFASSRIVRTRVNRSVSVHGLCRNVTPGGSAASRYTDVSE